MFRFLLNHSFDILKKQKTTLVVKTAQSDTQYGIYSLQLICTFKRNLTRYLLPKYQSYENFDKSLLGTKVLFGSNSCNKLSNEVYFFIQKRYKKKKASKSNHSKGPASLNEDDEDEDDIDEFENTLNELGSDDSRIFHTTVLSFRLDSLGKTFFNVSRSKFDQNFYDNLIRVNGERVAKKSHEIHTGDEIDLIRGFNVENQERLDINRVKVLKLDDKASSNGRYKVSYLKTNKLTIDNYERDPYDGSSIST